MIYSLIFNSLWRSFFLQKVFFYKERLCHGDSTKGSSARYNPRLGHDFLVVVKGLKIHWCIYFYNSSFVNIEVFFMVWILFTLWACNVYYTCNINVNQSKTKTICDMIWERWFNRILSRATCLCFKITVAKSQTPDHPPT